MKNTPRYRTVLTVAIALSASGILGCRTAAGAAGERTGSECDREAPGTLRVANSSGRILDVYVARSDSPPQLLTQISPGTSSATSPARPTSAHATTSSTPLRGSASRA
jgi:hypothetical protein